MKHEFDPLGLRPETLLAAAAERRLSVSGMEIDGAGRISSFSMECRRGHRSANGKPVTTRSVSCPACAGRRGRLVPVGSIAEDAASRGGRLVSRENPGGREKLEWECSAGHRFEAELSSVRHSGSWCPHCAESTGEMLARKAIEEISGRRFPKARPSWLVGPTGRPLELDGFCEELGIAFEYQGRQHDGVDPFFHDSPEDFEMAALRDRMKRDGCRRLGIELIVVPQVDPPTPDRIMDAVRRLWLAAAGS